MLPPIHRWDPHGQPRAAVHILHGMAEHGGRYERVARALNAAGMNAWAHDHRGHGANPTSGVMGHFADRNGWQAVLDDVRAVSNELVRVFPDAPLILFAHSMGSFMAQAIAASPNPPFSAMVLCGTNGAAGFEETAVRLLARMQLRALGPRAPGTLLKKLVFGRYNRQFAPTRTEVDWLSRDTQEVDKYRQDPRCGFALTSQAWLDFLEGKRNLGSRPHLERIPRTLPIHVIAGTRDAVGENGAGVMRLLKACESAGLTVSSSFYEGARHELVNETNRDVVTCDVIEWIQQVVVHGPA
jgi:alpha-beta hydrolase superfamily lysophospholipase